MGFFEWFRKDSKVAEAEAGVEGAPTAIDPALLNAQSDAPSLSALRNLSARYENPRLLNEGGMAEVYRAFDKVLKRDVALKVLKRNYSSQSAIVGYFEREACLTALLDHPNIPPMFDLGVNDLGVPVMVMQLIGGQSLRQMILERWGECPHAGFKTITPFLEIVLKICDALSYAHDLGYVHGDIKPENVMVGSYGETYLMDWTLARKQGEAWETISGTPQYMAPEQASGQALDAHADIFSLGAMLYEFLTGNPPYIAETDAERFELARACHIPSPETLMGTQIPPDAIVQMTMKALEKEPSKRYQSIREMRTELDQYLKGSWKYGTRHYQRGEFLIREGEVGDQAFLIKSGECEVFRTNQNGEELFQATLKAGQTFGELSIFTKDLRSASVRARSDVSVQVIDQKSLNDWLDIDPVIANFVQVLAARFKDMQDKKAISDAKTQRDNSEGPYLIELARRIGQRGAVSLAEATNLAVEKGLDESYLSVIHNHSSFQVSDDSITLI